jgi:hypothetical protein
MKTGISIMLLLFLGSALFGQKPGMTGGLEGGLNFYSPPYNYDTSGAGSTLYRSQTTVFIGGPFLVFQLNNIISFKTAAWYTWARFNGVKYYYPDNISAAGLHYTQYYTSAVRVPLLFRLNYGKGVRYFFELGPGISFANDRKETWFTDAPGSYQFLEKKTVNEVLFNFYAGVGLSYMLKDNLYLHGEAMFSASSSAPNSIDGTTVDFNMLFGLGYQFWFLDKSGSTKGDIFNR